MQIFNCLETYPISQLKGVISSPHLPNLKTPITNIKPDLKAHPH